MLKTKTQKLILITILLIICSVLIYIYKNPPPKTINNNTLLKQNSPDPNSKIITLLINEAKYTTNISEETSVYDFMDKLRTEGKIDFKDKTYSGMGKFIEEINGIKNGEKYWIYYVNNKKANIGVSNYKINEGDIVSWKYEKDY
ncbi:MAG: DUF4430 domain-containing protein [Minisyncoccia bacterium]